MPPVSQYSMLSHYQFESHTKLQNFKKNAFIIYVYIIHTCLNVALATKLEKLQKNASMTYACVIHVCLDVALREGDLRPSVISKEHLPTSAAYS